MTLLALILATFASEDLTCISAGLLVSRREIPLATALTGCYVGILLGDIGLWLIGRVLGATVLTWPRVRRRLPVERIERFTDWLDRHGGKAVVTARFVPGMRFPTYVAAGALGRRAGRFVMWAALAGLVWTPLLVGIVSLVGAPIADPLERLLNNAWIALAVAALLLFVCVRIGVALTTEIGRARLAAKVSRIWRWEFWPMWIFYAPLVPWIAWLSLRYRGIRTITAANPAIPHGGLVGESKGAILEQLPSQWVVPFARIASSEPADRRAELVRLLDAGWSFPLVLKPDVGERGSAVRLIRDMPAAEVYLALGRWPVLAQAYHPGPFEAGIFYCRTPEERDGRIFSITDKVFAGIVGDGEATLETLIWRHPRYRMQAATFLARLNGAAQTILADGEQLPLAMAGNHCQGTLFRDGAHLHTRALAERVDEIASSFNGFFFGRFDIRYRNADRLRAGEDFAIIELNGASSESTNIYDPRLSLFSAYGILARQWRTLFAIGAANRARGCHVSSNRELLDMWREYRNQRTAIKLSD